MVLLGGKWDQQLSEKGLESFAAEVSFVLVYCLYQPSVCLVTVGLLIPPAA